MRWRRPKSFYKLRRESIPFPAVGCDEIHREIERLNIRESVLSEPQFMRLRVASETINDVVAALQGRDSINPRLFYLLRNVKATTELIDPIDKVFDAKGKCPEQCLRKAGHDSRRYDPRETIHQSPIHQVP